MKLNKSVTAAFAALAVSLGFTNCSDTIDTPDRPGDVDAKPGVTIFIPNIENAFNYGRSRADGNETDKNTAEALEEEASIKNMYLVMIDKDENLRLIDMKALKPDTENLPVNGSYTPYRLPEIESGNYKLYVLANLDKYLGQGKSVEDIKSESELKSVVLDFADIATDATIEKGELPMACMALKEDPSEIAKEEHELTGYKSLYADLSFLCAKVRYTILFDSEPGGFSNSFNGSVIDFDENPKASNIRSNTSLVEDFEYNKTFFDTDLSPELNKVAYPTEEGYPVYDKSTGKVSDNLAPLGSTGSWTGKRRAWQGVVYLPENLETEESASVLTFTGVKDKGTSFATVINPHFDLKSGEKGMTRGHFYDFLAKITDYNDPEIELTVNVLDWNLKSISYQLHGPYELVVETTEIEVKSGSWSEPFWYTSDVDITFDFPKIPVKIGEGTDGVQMMNFYKAEKIEEDGKKLIHLQVNPEIPYNGVLEFFKDGQEYSDPLNADNKLTKDDVNYFHIVAGSIRKKIRVYPLDLNPILEVSPLEIIIDVREIVQSGKNGGVIEISYETNVESSINVTVPDDLKNQDNPLTLRIGEETEKEIFNGGFLPNKVGKLYLTGEDFFGGNEYWTDKNGHEYELSFSVDGITENKKVKIIVKPYSTDYTIHFRCINDDHKWTNPHVYIYQCLELPADLKANEEDMNNPEATEIHPYASKTVGYYEYDGSNPVAALEYFFSNNIAFKGWYYYGGAINPYGNGTLLQDEMGFIHVGGYQGNTSGFNPSRGNTSFYNYEVNLNAAHLRGRTEDNWKCPSCKQYRENSPSDFNKANLTSAYGSHMFAGVCMEYEGDIKTEGDGWYKYTLSGAATPGKCLIIFFDGHVWDDLSGNNKMEQERYHRYPTKKNGEDTAGLALFDYPAKEGWLQFDGYGENRTQTFTDIEPTIPERVYENLYIVGDMTKPANASDWNNAFKLTYQFYKNGTNKWRTNTIGINSGIYFKVASNNWNINLCANGNLNVSANTVIELQTDQTNSMTLSNNFVGYAELELKNGTYYLTLVSLAND